MKRSFSELIIMATFIEEKKKQRRLIYILIAVLLITFLVIWFGFFRKPDVAAPTALFPGLEFRKVDVDLSLLESPALRELEEFEGVPPFEGEVGRENPFLPF